MKLKTVGYYKEMPHGRKTNNSILDSINKEKPENIEKIYQYLRGGVEFIVSPEITQDIIAPEKGTSGIASSYTDGIWLWPGDLAYYVKNYNLKLPDEFISTMKDNDWQISKTIDDMNYDEIVIDGVKMFEE
ncbi:MAG: hypothetical protein K6F99_08820 [Lachnospiraceae bacterium]|nr:hypothetical protein [Lachnospiraceae bacterium]